MFNASVPAIVSPSATQQYTFPFGAQQQQMMMPSFPQQQAFLNAAAQQPMFAMPQPQGMFMNPYMMYNMQAGAMFPQQQQQQALISPTPDRFRLSSSSTPKVVDDTTRFVFPATPNHMLSAQPQALGTLLSRLMVKNCQPSGRAF